MKKRVGSEIGDEHIGEPVPIIIGRSDAHSPASIDKAALDGHVGKSPISIVSKQVTGGRRQGRVGENLKSGPIHEQDV